MASLVCATCRKLIPPGTNAIRCTVASCNTGRMKLRFCSVLCWEKHIPTARHRKAAYVVEGERDATVEPAGDSE
jgi:LSD1 subclass zinc finger protein